MKIIKEDFENAEYESAFDCPIARAAKRDITLRPGEMIAVGISRVYIHNQTGERIKFFPIPFEINQRVLKICLGQELPREIEFDLISEKAIDA